MANMSNHFDNNHTKVFTDGLTVHSSLAQISCLLSEALKQLSGPVDHSSNVGLTKIDSVDRC